MSATELVRSYISSHNIHDVLKNNPYELVVNCNLWFRSDIYQVRYETQDNQILRLRFYNNKQLTPLILSRNDHKIYYSLTHSVYRPHFPETFYAMIEMLHDPLVKTPTSTLLIGQEFSQGYLESIIYTQTCNTYRNDCLLVDGTVKPILSQPYNCRYFDSFSDVAAKYELVVIDCISKMDDMVTWTRSPNDLISCIYHLSHAISHIDKNSSILIKLNMFMDNQWGVLLNIVGELFTGHHYIRPTILNSFDPTIYLYLTGYKKQRYNMCYYNALYLDNQVLCSFETKDEKLPQDFIDRVTAWSRHLKQTITNARNDWGLSKMYAEKWYKEHDMETISDIMNIRPMRSEYISLSVPTTEKTSIRLTDKRNDIGTDIRIKLNKCKNVMNTMPSLIYSEEYQNKPGKYLSWESLSYSLYQFKKLKGTLKYEYNAEITTNAWTKLYEIVSHLDWSGQERCKVFHLCEAPGAFISACNHYFTTHNIEYDWYAQTLIERDGALGDHYGLMKQYSHKWLYGKHKGDITNTSLIQEYSCDKKLRKINMITADGGIQISPTQQNDQEALLAKIVLGQIICILACLDNGGTAIIKMFLPLLEPLTISLIYLVSQHFDKVEITKPETSKTCNSEVYIVASGYKGVEPKVLAKLYTVLDMDECHHIWLYKEIPASFTDTYTGLVKGLVARQIHSLRLCYRQYYGKEPIHTTQKSKEWVDAHNIHRLDKPLLGQN